MVRHSEIEERVVISKIKQREFLFAGNRQLKIFGMLHCKTGKKMKKENRIFFGSQAEAIDLGYRPCGHCMKNAYEKWKLQFHKLKKIKPNKFVRLHT